LVSQYKVHTIRLGCGTYGEVWQATCKRTGQDVAAKYVLRTEYGDDTEVFLREVDILRTLPRHPNIVEMLDVFISDWENPVGAEELLCVIMMELCQHTLEREWNKVQGRAPDSDAEDWEGTCMLG
jgi:serine/threonine protein kinase